MAIQSPKRLLVFTLSIVAVFFTLGITQATANNFFGSHVIFPTPVKEPISHIVRFPDTDFTPQERQKLQGVRQRRNKEINEFLDSHQRTQLEHELHISHDIEQALALVNLQPEQKKFVNAVIEFTNLKMQSIFSHHALLENKSGFKTQNGKRSTAGQEP